MKTRYREKLDEMKLNGNTESNSLTEKHFTSSNNRTMEPTKNNVPVRNLAFNQYDELQTGCNNIGWKYSQDLDQISHDSTDNLIRKNKFDHSLIVNKPGEFHLRSLKPEETEMSKTESVSAYLGENSKLYPNLHDLQTRDSPTVKDVRNPGYLQFLDEGNGISRISSLPENSLYKECSIRQSNQQDKFTVEADVNEKSQRMTTPPVSGNIYKVICDYTSNDDNEISVKKGDVVTVVNVYDNWLQVRDGIIEGLIPVNVIDHSSHSDVFKTKHLLTQTPIKSKDGLESASISSLLNKVFSLNFFFILIPLFGFLIYIFCLGPYVSYSDSTVKSTYTLDERITYLENKFSHVNNDSLNDLSNTLYSCLSSTLNGDKPCIILLLSDGDKIYSDLHREIGLLSAAVFHKHENDIITIKSSALTDISCTFFEKYKKLLDENKVMLVLDLEKVPMEVIKQFHSLCDEYNPAVKQSVIVFMLNYRDIEADFGKNDASYANNLLHKLWEKHIPKDLLEALAIRISGNVVRLGGRKR